MIRIAEIIRPFANIASTKCKWMPYINITKPPTTIMWGKGSLLLTSKPVCHVILKFYSCIAQVKSFLELINLTDSTIKGKYIEKCNGRIKPGNSCETNAERGKYIRLQEKKEKLWRKKENQQGKQLTSYLTSTGDFCPPFKNLLSRFSQGYFSISYIFSQDTHTFLIHISLFSPTLFSPNGKGYVLKTVFVSSISTSGLFLEPFFGKKLEGAVINDRILPSKFRGGMSVLDPALSYLIWMLIVGVTSALYAISLNKIELFDDDKFDTEDKNIEDDCFCEFSSEVFK